MLTLKFVSLSWYIDVEPASTDFGQSSVSSCCCKLYCSVSITLLSSDYPAVI